MENSIHRYRTLLKWLPLLVSTTLFAQAGQVATRGRDFWLSFMQNVNSANQLSLKVASISGTSGTVSIPLMGWTTTFTVGPNGVASIVIPNTAMPMGSEIVRNCGIHLTSVDSVTVSAYNYQQQTTDAAQIIPVSGLGTIYRAEALYGSPATYNDGTYMFRSELLVAATEDGTEVTITPSALTTAGRSANTPFTISLNAGEVYQVQALNGLADLSGTLIEGTAQSGPCRPFAVFAGSMCATVGCQACDHVYEQMLPVNSWGTHFHTVPYNTYPSYSYRVQAAQNNTSITVDGGSPYILNAGQVHETLFAVQPTCIVADHPISVSQMMQGYTCNNVGDPSLLVLQADERSTHSAVFTTLSSTISSMTHHITVVTATPAIGQVQLDGAPVSSSLFSAYPGCGGFSYAKLQIPAGTHKLTSVPGFIAYAYGLAQGESYLYSLSSESAPSVQQSQVICSNDPLTLTSPEALSNAVWTAVSAPSTILASGNSYTFTPAQNDIYRVDGVILPSGCARHFEFQVGLPITSSALDLQVNGSPTTTVCQYSPVQLSTQPALSAQWFNLQWTPSSQLNDANIADPVAYPNSTTWYKLSVVSPVGCGTATDSVLVTVTPSDVYAIHATVTNASICSGNSTTLEAKTERVQRTDRFEGALASWWSQVQGGALSAACGSISGTALYFNGSGVRSATTTAMDMTGGGKAHFALKIASGAAPCDDAETGEDVVLEYSTNGSTWTTVTYSEASYPVFTSIDADLPSAPNLQVRWRQLSNSGAGQDNWALDNVVITRNDNSGLGIHWSPTAALSLPNLANTTAAPTANTWYHVTTTTATGCTYTDSVLVTVAPAFNILPINDTTRCGTPGTQLQAMTSSGTGITWSWLPGNGSLSSTTVANPVATPTLTTSYTVSATSSIGCTDTEDLVVHVSRLTGLSATSDDTQLCQGEHAQLSATIASTGAYSVSWSPTTGLASPTSAITLATPLSTTTYICTVTDTESGCSLTSSVTLNVNTAYTAHTTNDTLICTALGLQLHVDHNVPVPFGISWSPAINLNAGNIASPTILADTSAMYVVTITDQNGCSVHDSTLVTVAFDNLITPIHVSSCAGVPLVLNAGFPGSTYDWNTTESTQSITVNSPGTYTATMTDIRQCQAIENFVVAFNALPVVDLGPDVSLCGIANYPLNANNVGNSVTWNTGQHTQQISATSTDTFSVEVTTPDGCHASDTIMVTLNPLPADVLQDVTVCSSTQPVLDAGNSGCTYLWNTQQTSQTIVPHSSGTYSVTVTTPELCSATYDVQVTLMPEIHVDLGPDTTLCASAPLVLDAGIPGLTYTWSTGEHTQTIAATSSATYSVTATNGFCSGTDDKVVNFNALPLDVLTDVTSCVDQPVTLNAGNTGASYLWSDQTIGQSITTSTAGTYSVTITNAANCSATYDAVVAFSNYPVVDLGPDASLCEGDELVLDATVAGATYSWSTGAHTASITATHDGTYSVDVSNGYCTTMDMVHLVFNPLPSALATHQYFTCLDEEPHQVRLDAGNTGCTYLWSTGQHDQVIFGTTYGWYHVQIMNAFGCSISDSAMVNEFCQPTLFLPNTFTPNGDGLNDVWGPVGRNIAEMDLTIFDRWGAVIFQSNDPNKAWDGTIKGVEAKNDTYAYRLSYRFVEDSSGELGFEQKQMGNVQVMR